MDNVNRVAELEMQMTMTDGAVNPGAKEAFDGLYRQYGLPGVQALHDAGHDNPQMLWDFFVKCKRQVSEMAYELGLK